MKKLTCVFLCALMAFGLLACAAPAQTPAATQAPVEEAPAAAQAEVPATEPKPAAMDNLNSIILYEQDDAMINTYSLLAVNEAAPFVDADGNAVSDVAINTAGAKALIDWMLSDAGAALVKDYGFAEYGEHLFYLREDRPVSAAEIPQAADDIKTIRLSTTTSVNDSGLLGYLLPKFEEAYGYTVEVASAGTGKAIAAAQYGNADLILVHSKSQEEQFVADGFSKTLEGYETERLSFMYNYFVLIGPRDDPARCAEAATVKDAFRLIAEGKFPFVSRGDKSGTHTKELSLWPEGLGITAEPDSVAGYTDWYTFSNAGMGACLTMANETNAYILSDKATFLTFCANGGAIQ